jgi:hypothetical protein
MGIWAVAIRVVRRSPAARQGIEKGIFRTGFRKRIMPYFTIEIVSVQAVLIIIGFPTEGKQSKYYAAN